MAKHDEIRLSVNDESPNAKGVWASGPKGFVAVYYASSELGPAIAIGQNDNKEDVGHAACIFLDSEDGKPLLQVCHGKEVHHIDLIKLARLLDSMEAYHHAVAP